MIKEEPELGDNTEEVKIKEEEEEEDTKKRMPYTCPHCNKGFFYEDYFLEHLQEHNTSPATSSSVSNVVPTPEHSSVVVKQEQENSEATNSVEMKPVMGFSCARCGTRFLEESEFMSHLQTHCALLSDTETVNANLAATGNDKEITPEWNRKDGFST